MRTSSRRGYPAVSTLILVAVLAVQGCDAGRTTASTPEAPGLAHAKSGPPAFGPWGTPVNLGAPVNTSSGENRPFISDGDDQLFFTSGQTAGSQGANDLWVSRRADASEPWGAPVNLGPVVNSAGDDLAAFLTADGKQLYFARAGGCGDVDLWMARRHNKHQDTGWDTAVELGCTVSSAGKDADPFLVESGAEDGTLYFLSDRDPANGFDVYRSSYDKKTGEFGPAVPVPELNSPAVEFKIVIRPDGLEAFVGSARPGSSGTDIWVSTLASQTDPWGPPVNLGPGINSAGADAPGSLSADGTTLYFQSNRPGGSGQGDVWMVRRPRIN